MNLPVPWPGIVYRGWIEPYEELPTNYAVGDALSQGNLLHVMTEDGWKAYGELEYDVVPRPDNEILSRIADYLFACRGEVQGEAFIVATWLKFMSKRVILDATSSRDQAGR